MGSIPDPEENIIATHKVLKIGPKRLLLTIHATPDSDMLYFGSATTYCAKVQILSAASPFIVAMEHSDAMLVELHYNVNCSLEKNFQRGTDTTMIVALVISVIKDLYPFIEGIRFTDTSYRTCDNGTIVELAEMNYIVTGKTWYETRFGAKLVDREEDFLSKSAKFQDIKKIIPWNTLKWEMRMASSLPLPEDTMKEMYKSTVTWQEFFGLLRSKIGISEFCSFVAPWLHGFLMKLLRFHFSSATYRIQINTAQTLSYITEPYLKGAWRPQMRKRMKRRPINDT